MGQHGADRPDGHVLVTGAASGIGAATVEALRRRGRRTVGWDIAAPGGTGDLMRVDVADAADVERAWNEVVGATGRITGLVNAAGIWMRGGSADLSVADWQRTIAVNLTATFLTCAKAMAHMKENGGGAIVNLASVAAVRAPRLPALAYAASKGGVVSFTRALAAEGVSHDVRCNCVSPGPVATPMLDQIRQEAKSFGDGLAFDEAVTPAAIADVIALLLSREAASLNGLNLEVPAV